MFEFIFKPEVNSSSLLCATTINMQTQLLITDCGFCSQISKANGYAASDGSVSGAYEARVEACGEVMSAFNSAKQMQLEVVKQYCVSALVKVE